jgi:hypothetical protein
MLIDEAIGGVMAGIGAVNVPPTVTAVGTGNVSSGSAYFAPLTFSGPYGYSGGTMEIGGATCHLCGAATVVKNVYGRRTKRGRWKETKYIRYACGTYMYVKASGKKDITRGAKCVRDIEGD